MNSCCPCEQREAGCGRRVDRHADAADGRSHLLQDDQGKFPEHPCRGRRQCHHAAARRIGASHERFFTDVFDSAILYEGEHALLWLLDALDGQRTMNSVPNLMHRDETGIHVNQEIYTEKTTALPLPDFDGLPLDHYFVPERIIPYLATRGCYWGRCTFLRPWAGLLRSISRNVG